MNFKKIMNDSWKAFYLNFCNFLWSQFPCINHPFPAHAEGSLSKIEAAQQDSGAIVVEIRDELKHVLVCEITYLSLSYLLCKLYITAWVHSNSILLFFQPGTHAHTYAVKSRQEGEEIYNAKEVEKHTIFF